MFFKNRKNKNKIEKNVLYRRTVLIETYKKQDNHSVAFGVNNFAIGHYAIYYGTSSTSISYSFSL